MIVMIVNNPYDSFPIENLSRLFLISFFIPAYTVGLLIK